MTAKDPSTGKVWYRGKREYFEVGLDIQGRMRYGAWQIKEILDLSLPPRLSRPERFLFTLPPDTREVEVGVTLYYCLKDDQCTPVRQTVKRLRYPRL